MHQTLFCASYICELIGAHTFSISKEETEHRKVKSLPRVAQLIDLALESRGCRWTLNSPGDGAAPS